MTNHLGSWMAGLCLATLVTEYSLADEYLSGLKWSEPAVVASGTPSLAPSDAVVLFDGKDLSQWSHVEQWKVVDGAMLVGPGAALSKAKFGDCQLHIEFATPKEVEGNGQGRGNSGVFLMNRYEVQILDSYKNKTYFDGQCGAIYKQTPPLVNASRKPGEWQTYDIIWKAPRFLDGKLESPAFITVLHNGVLIVNHFQLQGDTPYNRPPKYTPHPEKDSIRLQYHLNPTRFRNIWVREITALSHERTHGENKISYQRSCRAGGDRDLRKSESAHGDRVTFLRPRRCDADTGETREHCRPWAGIASRPVALSVDG